VVDVSFLCQQAILRIWCGMKEAAYCAGPIRET
jgi:hypothetical protein